jgi:hypothetical protein
MREKLKDLRWSGLRGTLYSLYDMVNTVTFVVLI